MPCPWSCRRKRRKRWRWKITLCITHFGEKSLPFVLFIFLFYLEYCYWCFIDLTCLFFWVRGFFFSKLSLGFSERWRGVFKSTCIFISSHIWNYCGLICITEIQPVHFKKLNLSKWIYMNSWNRKKKKTFCFEIISKYNRMDDYI